MSPTWIPLCKCMQRYCEPYFTAIERWRQYEDTEILRNRITLIETAFKILTDFSQNTETYDFDLAYENPDASLEEETLPSAGKNFVFGGDTQAYEASKRLVPESIFNRVGVFFQQNMLKAMAGWSENYLLTANAATRGTVIAAIEKLLRLPLDAGKAHFVYRRVESDDQAPTKQKMFSTSQLSLSGQAFVDFLIESKGRPVGDVYNSPTSDKKRKAPEYGGGNSSSASKSAKKKKKSHTSNVDDDEPQWDTTHSTVGMEVANYFPVPPAQRVRGGPSRKIFKGRVTMYAPPSKPKSKDQLYHIVWEDGDEEDYEQDQFNTAVGLFYEMFGDENKKNESKGNSSSASNAESNPTALEDAGDDEMEVDEEPKRPSRVSRESKKAVVDSPSRQTSSNSKKVFSASKSASKKESDFSAAKKKLTASSSKRNTKAEEEEEQEVDTDEWTTEHESVGTKVAAVFKVRGKSKIYQGEVVRYCPPTAAGKKDQLYHVRWEDSDEEDYEIPQLTAGKKLYAKEFGASEEVSNGDAESPIEWTEDDASVGTLVAAYFPPRGSKKKLYQGRIVRYAPPTAPGADDALYHAQWEDGDSCDFDVPNFQKAVELYQKNYGTASAAPSTTSAAKKDQKRDGSDSGREEDNVSEVDGVEFVEKFIAVPASDDNAKESSVESVPPQFPEDSSKEKNETSDQQSADSLLQAETQPLPEFLRSESESNGEGNIATGKETGVSVNEEN